MTVQRIGQITQRLDEWLWRFLDAPGMPARTLIRKRWAWIWQAFAAFGILTMTVLGAFLHLRPIIWFGGILLVYYAFVVPLMGYVRNFDRLNLILQILVILTAFVFILRLGGIVSSMGLVFVGLSCSIASVVLNNARWTVWVFLIYASTIILAGLVQPYLHPDPKISPSDNLLYWVLNTLWLTGSTLNFILFYIEQRSRFEEAETNRLLELDEAKTKLYTNITHEFRTPLTIILGATDQIEAEPEKELAEKLGKIRRNSANLLQLVDQVLNLSKLEAGVMPLHLIQADLLSYLAYLAESFHVLASEKNITLRTDFPNPPLIMDYDPDKMASIVSNLLSNAIKFTPPGGKVTLSVKQLDKTGHFLTKTKTGTVKDQIVIRIQDTGPGIPSDQIPLIFDRYFQVEHHLKAQGGFGLGLTLVKELVQLLNGSLKVESTPGQGTTFSVLLPVSHQALLQEVPTGPEEDIIPGESVFTTQDIIGFPTDGPLPVLLIVEDNPDVTDYLKSILKEKYELICAADGQDGWKKAVDLIPDIVLSDVMMPVMDGFELLSKLKQDFRTSHIPVVLLTAKADIESRLEGLERGADAYLAKPFNRQELLVQIRKLLELRRKLQVRYQTLKELPPTRNRNIQTEDSFIRRVHALLDQHLDDETFGVSQLARALAMSRAQLYRKFTVLTNRPINKYLLSFRLHRARALLESGSVNVTRVALETGFKSPTHFSRLFTAEFGMNPRDIIPHG